MSEVESQIIKPALGAPEEHKVSDLSDDARALNFVREQVPSVRGKELLSYTTQVVAGISYVFHFEGHYKIKVWSKPFEKGFLQINLPHGVRINNF